MRGLFIAAMLVIILSKASFAQSCDYKVEILPSGEDFKKEGFKWQMMAAKIDGKSTNITGTADIKAGGKTIKRYKPWTLAPISKQKTSSEYPLNLEAGNYEITAEIKVECNDTNKGNNIDSKNISITGAQGAEAKKSENTGIGTNNQAQDLELAIANPKKLMPNEDAENTIETTNKKTQQNQKLPTTNAVKNTETIYTSSSEKAKSLIMPFLLALSILLNIILIWKR